MAMLLIFFLCLSSVYSEEMKMDMMKGMMADKKDDSAMTVLKLKRDSYQHSTPCPPYWPRPMPEYPKVHVVQQPQYVHKPTVTVVKPQEPSYSHGYNKYDGWSKPSYGWPMSSGWQTPQYHQPIIPQYHKPIIPQYQKPIVPQYHKPIYPQYKPIIPQYHKPTVIKPDCPPYQHSHVPQHTGIVYAPKQEYDHQPPIKYIPQEPQYVKVVKPSYHPPPPVYHPPPPVYHKPVYQPHPSPPIHIPVHQPKVEICDK